MKKIIIAAYIFYVFVLPAAVEPIRRIMVRTIIRNRMHRIFP